MYKFKIGEKVIINSNKWGHDKQTVTITELPNNTIIQNHYIIINQFKESWSYEENALQKIKKTKHKVFNI